MTPEISSVTPLRSTFAATARFVLPWDCGIHLVGDSFCHGWMGLSDSVQADFRCLARIDGTLEGRIIARMAKRKSKSQPTWTDVKAKLADFDRAALLGLIQSLYAAHKDR
jgi:hypothetical protein